MRESDMKIDRIRRPKPNIRTLNITLNKLLDKGVNSYRECMEHRAFFAKATMRRPCVSRSGE